MSLRTLLKQKLIACTEDTSIQEVAEMMESDNIGAILVLDEGRPVGIVTDRDIVIKCVVRGIDCAKLPVKDIMTTGVETVDINEGIYDVLQIMKKAEVRRVPVVDENGFAVGLLSFGDVFQLLAEELSALAPTASPEDPKIVSQAA
jgi:CBS domain-containing protein